MPSVWGERQNPLGDLPGLWPLLPGGGVDASPQTPTSLTVDSARSRSSSLPLHPDHCSFHARPPHQCVPQAHDPTQLHLSRQSLGHVGRGFAATAICGRGPTPAGRPTRLVNDPGDPHAICPCGGGRRPLHRRPFYAPRSGCPHRAPPLGDTHDGSRPYVSGCRWRQAVPRLARLARPGAGPRVRARPGGSSRCRTRLLARPL